jgi:hypothetical protein
MTTEVCTDGSFAGVIFSIGPPMRPLIKRPPHYLFEVSDRFSDFVVRHLDDSIRALANNLGPSDRARALLCHRRK